MPGGTEALLGNRARMGRLDDRANGAGARRRAAGPDYRGSCSRALATPSVRGDGVPIYDIRLLVVGADCLLRDSLAEDGEPAMVAGYWSGRWRLAHDQGNRAL